jgi:Aspartyl protease
MPVFPNRVPNLQQVGPIIEIIIFPAQPLVLKISEAGKLPNTKKVIALIDTGASGSCINDPIAKELGLIDRDVVLVSTPSGAAQQPVYDIGIALPGLTKNPLPVQALGANLDNQPFAALIGRDILVHCTLIYNGWDNSYQLHL